MKRQSQAYLYAALAVALWSTVAAAFKLSLRHLSPPELLLLATLASSLVLLCVVALTRRVRDFPSWTAADFLRSAALGFLNPFLYYRVLFEAYALLPAQEAQALNFLWPIVLALLSIVVLNQRITAGSFAAMFTSFSGVVVIATQGDLVHLHITDSRGVLLALVSTVIWASYWVYGLKDRRDPIARMCANFIFGSLFAAAYGLWRTPPRIPSLAGILGALYVGTFEMGVTFIFWLMALRLSSTTARVANLVFLTPFLSLFFLHYVVEETIRPSTLAGLSLIVAGNLLQRRPGDGSVRIAR